MDATEPAPNKKQGPAATSPTRSAGTNPPPQVILGMWQWWADSLSNLPSGRSDGDVPWRQQFADAAIGGNLAASVKQLQEAVAADPTLRAIDQMWNANPLRSVVPVDWAEVSRALRTVWLRSLRDPVTTAAAATTLSVELWRNAFEAWTDACQRLCGTATGAPQDNTLADKRFAAPEWQNHPTYRTLKAAYLLASDWLLQQAKAPDLEPAERLRLSFHLRQFVDASAPTLGLFTNPIALRKAMETGGASVADGLRNLLDDLRAGRLSMVDESAFAPGRNLALSPGKVVYRNKLIELIQYAPTTPDVHAVPLLILPPWINKYYILDLQPKNSMVRFLVDQGFTVFVVSWKNPDAAMEDTTIEDYMRLGPLAASEAAREITGSDRVNVMGYCIGGTLLALTLAWLAAKDDRRFASATFMVSLQDFSRVGDTAVFLGSESIDLIEQQMLERGYLDSREMSNMFNLLRSNDLIWSNVVNNYLLGEKPPAFDLLYWNSDSTRMARAAHTWYLRNTYVENNLIVPGKARLMGEPIDLSRIALDTYAVGAEKDHIVPWDAAWKITRLFGGKVRFVRASSGHIAGIINPPGGKGMYWTHELEAPASTAEEWLRGATRTDGSWWGDWSKWLAERAGPRRKPPALGSSAHPSLEDAPGTYVMEH